MLTPGSFDNNVCALWYLAGAATAAYKEAAEVPGMAAPEAPALFLGLLGTDSVSVHHRTGRLGCRPHKNQTFGDLWNGGARKYKIRSLCREVMRGISGFKTPPSVLNHNFRWC